MSDDRLDSVHLRYSRKERFREAREALFDAEGLQTLIESQRESGASRATRPGNTAVLNADGDMPAYARFYLVDRRYSYPLKVGINTVGRMPDNDVVLSDPYVSRRHVAILVHSRGNCELHDIASKNGTTINGEDLRGPTVLHSGDKISLSDHELIFLDNSGEEAELEVDPTLFE